MRLQRWQWRAVTAALVIIVIVWVVVMREDPALPCGCDGSPL